MIRFRPVRETIIASLRDEETYTNVSAMLSAVCASWARIVSYMGAREPFRADELMISGAGKPNPMTGYLDEHRVLVRRMADSVYREPLCIGYCDLEG